MSTFVLDNENVSLNLTLVRNKVSVISLDDKNVIRVYFSHTDAAYTMPDAESAQKLYSELQAWVADEPDFTNFKWMLTIAAFILLVCIWVGMVFEQPL